MHYGAEKKKYIPSSILQNKQTFERNNFEMQK